jgi:AmmeMemoRadiSam system protein B
MSMRRRRLPPGWYPEDRRGIEKMLETWKLEKIDKSGLGSQEPGDMSNDSHQAVSAIAPHAGWVFSGRLAALSIAAIGAVETIVVIGGHVGAHSPILYAQEDSFETPLGPISADRELFMAVESALGDESAVSGVPIILHADDLSDNTVEVQLPLVKAFLPDARIIWLRAPNGRNAIALGRALAAAAKRKDRKVACLGSTDLTHYGSAYGFSPAGKGKAAETWVRTVNDKAFIDALLNMDADTALRQGEENRAACSSGAAVAALTFAFASGARSAKLLDYSTSLDSRKDESFVGYASLAYY